MSISVLRDWEDVDAPVLDQTDQGGLVRLLKTVLVDGYGTGGDEKPALGWELVEADSGTHASITQMVIRNPIGSGTHLTIDGSGIRDSDAHDKLMQTYFRAVESIESYESALGESPPANITGAFVNSGYQLATAGNVPWKIIGNGRSFWLVLKRTIIRFPGVDYYAGNWSPYFFGDYNFAYPSLTPWHFITIQDAQDGSIGWLFDIRNAGDLRAYVLRGLSQAPGGSEVDLYSGSIGESTYGSHDDFGPIAGSTNSISFTKWSIVEGSNILGTLPGIMSLQQRYSSTQVPDRTIVNADHTIHLLSASSSVFKGCYALIEGAGYDDAV